jgi:hypothetical protein
MQSSSTLEMIAIIMPPIINMGALLDKASELPKNMDGIFRIENNLA